MFKKRLVNAPDELTMRHLTRAASAWRRSATTHQDWDIARDAINDCQWRMDIELTFFYKWEWDCVEISYQDIVVSVYFDTEINFASVHSFRFPAFISQWYLPYLLTGKRCS